MSLLFSLSNVHMWQTLHIYTYIYIYMFMYLYSYIFLMYVHAYTKHHLVNYTLTYNCCTTALCSNREHALRHGYGKGP